jgi:hypothetical protein
MIHHSKNNYATDKEIFCESKHLQQISPFRRKGRSSPFDSMYDAEKFTISQKTANPLSQTKNILRNISSILNVNTCAKLDTHMSEMEMFEMDSDAE